LYMSIALCLDMPEPMVFCPGKSQKLAPSHS
jgi:hypothetical protein